MIDLVGMAGSGLVVGSLIARSTWRLRALGLAGAVVYITYGLLLGAWPVVATNTVTLSIHAFHLNIFLAQRNQPIASAGDGPAGTQPANQVRRM